MATKKGSGPMYEEAQFNVKMRGTKGGFTKGDGTQPQPNVEDVAAKGGLDKSPQENMAEGQRKGGQTRAAQPGTEGYREMGRKGGLGTKHKSGEEAAREKGIQINEAKYKTTAELSDVEKLADGWGEWDQWIGPVCVTSGFEDSDVMTCTVTRCS